MDYFKILKRAFNTVKDYKVLWIFGILVALGTAGGSSGGGSGGGNGATFSGGAENWQGFPENLPFDIVMPAIGALIAIAVGFVILMFLLGIVVAVARYVAENALIKLVDAHEDTGVKHSFKEGFRIGWSRSAWQIFLINLVTGLVMAVGFIVLLILAALPLLLLIFDTTVTTVIGIATTVILGIIVILGFILAAIIVNVFLRFARRACALEGLGVFAAIKEGFRMGRGHLGEVALMWLHMVGIGIVYGIAMIPVTIILLMVSGILAAIPSVLVWTVVRMIAGATFWPWVIAGVVGVPLFFIVMVAPLTLIGGWYEAFQSTVWTLTYRELKALEALDDEEKFISPAGEVPEAVFESDLPELETGDPEAL
ncbi:MAG: hypothetical protein JXB35_15675 [Anaerolineae bacterium]|nr:hypothetical protein [Anaerolineae bacterium]